MAYSIGLTLLLSNQIGLCIGFYMEYWYMVPNHKNKFFILRLQLSIFCRVDYLHMCCTYVNFKRLYKYQLSILIRQVKYYFRIYYNLIYYQF